MDDQAVALMQEFNSAAALLPATLTTMTVLIRVATPVSLDLQNIKNEFMSDAGQQLIQQITRGSNDIQLTSKEVFNNSLIFKCRGKEAVKVFTNGNMHMTGIKDLMDAVCLADVFAAMIKSYGASPDFSFVIQLANFCHTLADIAPSSKLDLGKLESHLRSRTPYATFYNTERHAGVIMRAPAFTLLTFESGKTIISSVTTPEELKEAGDFIKEHLTPLAQQCTVAVSLGATTRKRKFDYNQYLLLK